MQVVILCGGLGIRLRPQTRDIPKPMIRVGGRPILWHVMKSFGRFGYRDFILCLGYKGEVIRDYFRKSRQRWNVEFAETGANTPTGERVKRIEHLVKGGDFFTTYTDGLADLDLRKLREYHENKRTLATVTVVKPTSPFGIVDLADDGEVTRFEEKPRMDHWINGGFFVFSEGIFDHIEPGDVLEKQVFDKLVGMNQLRAFRHHGFWRCVDTYKDAMELNELARQKKPPWNSYRGPVGSDGGR